MEVIKGSGFRAEVRVLRVWVSRAQFLGLRVQVSGTGCLDLKSSGSLILKCGGYCRDPWIHFLAQRVQVPND